VFPSPLSKRLSLFSSLSLASSPYVAGEREKERGRERERERKERESTPATVTFKVDPAEKSPAIIVPSLFEK
jgi:hypothetical protein